MGTEGTPCGGGEGIGGRGPSTARAGSLCSPTGFAQDDRAIKQVLRLRLVFALGAQRSILAEDDRAFLVRRRYGGSHGRYGEFVAAEVAGIVFRGVLRVGDWFEVRGFHFG